MEAGLANRYIESRGNPHGQSKFISYKVQLHVPCSFYPKISKENNVWISAYRCQGYFEESMRYRRNPADRRCSMCGSRSHLHGNSTEDEYIYSDVETERKKCANDIRAYPETDINHNTHQKIRGMHPYRDSKKKISEL